MDNDYLKNCINFIDKGIKELKSDFADSYIKKHTSKMLNIFKELITEKDISFTKKDIINMIKDKKSELVEL